MRRTLLKWNFKKHEYEPYPVDPNWHTPLIGEMDEMVNCTECGTVMEFGDCFTSRKIHNMVGFGYPVCEACYEKEHKEELAAKAAEVSS